MATAANQMQHPRLKPFEKGEHHILNMPIKERIRFFQGKMEEATGRQASWEEAKKACYRQTKEMRKSDIYFSDDYTVMVYDGEAADFIVHHPELKGKCGYLSIRTNARGEDGHTAPIRNWEILWEIKEYFYMGRWAVEVYPPRERLVNSANQYHLIVLPADLPPLFGM